MRLGDEMTKKFTEIELLKGLGADGAHADEVATPTPEELEPLARLRGSVLKYEDPLADTWDEWFDSDPHEESEFLERRDQPTQSAKAEIETLAQRHDVVELLTGSEEMAAVLHKLTSEDDALDDTERLLAALEHAGVLRDDQVMALHVQYLNEKYGS